MSESPADQDPLECELESLRPAELPAEMVDRIGAAVAGPRHRGLWLIPAAAAAAGIVLAMTWHTFVKEITLPPTPVVTTTRASPAEEGGDWPALFAYRRAITGPPDALDELLERHAARALPAGPRVTASTELSALH